jgi:hypothetical protein
LRQRRFYNALESVTEQVCCTASLTRPDDPSRSWTPSDLLVRLYTSLSGTTLDDAAMEDLRKATGPWFPDADANTAPGNDKPGVANTRRAFERRRDPLTPFDEYCFALKTPPSAPVPLSCTECETALQWPEIVWMRRLLGVEDTHWDPDEVAWHKAVGIWVHAWIRDALGRSAGQPDAPGPPLRQVPAREDLQERLRAAAQRSRHRANAAFRARGTELPEWWIEIHRQAQTHAAHLLDLVAKLGEHGWRRAATEWSLPDESAVQIPTSLPLRVHGRIDVILRGDEDNHWIVDFKTGTAGKLTPAEVAGGSGLQVLLYALACEAAGIPVQAISLAHPADSSLRAASPTELASHERVGKAIQILAYMQNTGVFGMRGTVRNEFGFSRRYPLATLVVPPDVVTRKWSNTFDNPPRTAEGTALP